MKRYSGLLLLPPLMAAAWFSIQLARADAAFRRATPEGVARAVALAPSDTGYLLLRAMQFEYDGADPTPLLERAAALDPMNAAPLIRLGLAAEIRGDVALAEKYLLHAARVNRQFEPRWTLANFYFRRGNMDRFWPWMHAALEVSYGDRRPAFDLCSNASSDADQILKAIPRRREILVPYLEYLTASRRTAAIPAAAQELASIGDSNDRPVLLAAVDSLIAAHDAPAAQAVWHALGYPRLALFRGDFEPPESGAGFDWHFISGPGITHLAIDSPRSAHRIVLDGSESESAQLLYQTVHLEPHAHYILAWQATTQSIPSPTGFEWRIGAQHALIAANESSGQFEFTAPSALVPVTLVYSRPPGETRAEGSLELRHVAITGS